MHGISIVGVYSANVQPTETESICKQVHNFRDYLIACQIQGYAILGAALNYIKQHAAVHQLLDLAYERLKQQEKALGGRFNDW